MPLQNLRLFQKRIILLYLNAYDKLKFIGYLSKDWNKLVYSGKAWETLFDIQHDSTWNQKNFTSNTLSLFSSLKGLKTLYLTPYLINTQILMKQINNIQFLILNDEFFPRQIINMCKQPIIYQKITKLPHSITKLHIRAFWNKLCKDQQFDQEGINVQDNDKATPLHYAIQNNSLQAIELLIQKGADTNATNIQQRTPLHYAANFADPYILIRLIQSGADLNCKDLYGKTPAHFALMAKRFQNYQVLSNCGDFQEIFKK